ncbi:uncharacterized protein Z518_10675 [Rhinocladiella mackenziei CBS 650.93]|uniref:Zn(2)-C6 fungal-type domain-containing protein n=1 Tax=Rhinocladiella mackenziei CBS 650.93 TaxID=1442369 RepID=A0A0D2IV21_9EURO|nr:uncharacterized protein Z518_10675 [Rhinocladiella mackenziei CBS 650.93]KIX00535.1 hypothetical protein Z518_10675 [Rhinocladiella mackenziei CBS 650.93]
MGTPPNTSCARRVLSCARCRKRKIKCDRRLPVCTQCETTNHQCTGVSTIDSNAHVPRSLVQFLESQIAQWEIEIQAHKENDLVDSHDALPRGVEDPWAWSSAAAGSYEELSQPHPQDDLESNIIRSSEFRSMIGATMPTDPALTDLVSRVRMGLTPSAVLPSVTGQSPESRRVPVPASSGDESVDVSTLSTLPEHVLHTLVRKYIRHIFPISPVMSQVEINQNLDLVLATMRELRTKTTAKRVRPSFHFLAIYLILAISSTLGCAKTQHESRCLAFSEVLFQEAISHLSTSLSYPTDLASLQATLLILQYAEINPKCANIWILNGASMRCCLELGLHREPVRSVELDRDTIELRRRLFWAAYCMDRTISPAVQRPLYIPDAIINANFPQGASESPEESSIPPKQVTLDWTRYCRIQSEITEVHFQEKPLDRDWQDWLARVEGMLRRWYRDNQSVDNAVEFAYAHGLARIHRPSPRNPMPSPESLVTAFEAACRSARHNRESILNGFLRKPWLAAQNTAESAMVAIFCLRHAFEGIVTRYTAEEIFEKTKIFTSNLLALAAHGWPEISTFAASFERLLAPLITGVLMKMSTQSLIYPPALDAELNKFLLPTSTYNETYFGIGFSTNLPDLGNMGGITNDNLNWDEAFLETLASNTDKYSWGDFSKPDDLLVSFT